MPERQDRAQFRGGVVTSSRDGGHADSTRRAAADIDFAGLMEPVARHLLGEPNKLLSSPNEMRYGTRGSLTIDLKKGTWFDHELGDGGGMLDLVQRETRLIEAQRLQWLEDKGFLDGRAREPEPPRTNGRAGKTSTFKIIKTYDYTDENGTLLSQAVRFDPKDFRQRKPDPAGRDGWSWSVKGVRQVPYRLPELIEAIANEHVVCIVEGEKDADNLWRIGVPATTNAGGAGNWRAELNQHFVGADVVVIGDNDPQKKHPKTGAPMFHPDGRPVLPGQDHARNVARQLTGIAARVRVVDDLVMVWPECPPKGDISNWLDAGGTVERLNELIEQLPDDQAPPPGKQPTTDDDDAPHAEPLPPSLARLDLSLYDHQPIPERLWGVAGRFPLHAVCLLSGEGGRGKSIILLQLGVAHVLGRDWLRSMPAQGPVIIVNAEDDNDEIARRLKPILAHNESSFGAVDKDLHIFSLVGRDPLLAVLDRSGRIIGTPLFAALLQLAGDLRPVCIVIDNVADVFAGSEIDRSQVRQFVALMRTLTLASGGYVILSSHPSLTGISNKTGLSGSTQWHNATRARAWLHSGKDDAGDPDLRELEFLKSNYSALAETVPLRWSGGLYLPVSRQGFLDEAAANAAANELFLLLLDRCIRTGRNVSGKPNANNYAATVLAAEPEAKAARLSKTALEAAMRRLFTAEKLALEPYGPLSRDYHRVVRKAT